MPRPGVWITALVLPLLAGGCSRQSSSGLAAAESGITSQGRSSVSTDGDSGLELTTFVSGVDGRALAGALAPFVEEPVPVGHEMGELWASYGFRIVSVPVEQVPGLVSALQTAGSTQKQWLGQAYAWTEVVHAGQSSGRVIALDAERIRLAPGSLRLLVRSWIEPTMPSAGDGSGAAAPGATLRVEMVPQNRESRTPEQALDPLAVNEPRFEAESQGLLFSRLYTRMSLVPGRALVIVPDRPDADWKAMAAEPVHAALSAPAAVAKRKDEDREAVTWTKPSGPAVVDAPVAAVPHEATPPVRVGPPKLGEVVRAAPRPVEAAPKTVDVGAAEVGPVAVRVPTLGEAMLMGDPAPAANAVAKQNVAPPQRVLLVLVPRVPKEFRLLGPAPMPVAGPAGATPTAARP